MGALKGCNLDWEISAQETKAKLDKGEKFVFLDVREPLEIQTACIAGTLNIPMGEVPARIQELDSDDHIIVTCHHGARSMNVVAWLRQQGFERAQSMAGGIDDWSRTVDPKVPTY